MIVVAAAVALAAVVFFAGIVAGWGYMLWAYRREVWAVGRGVRLFWTVSAVAFLFSAACVPIMAWGFLIALLEAS